MGLYLLVSVATAAKYDLKTNIDVTDELTNGTECAIDIERLQTTHRLQS